MSHGGIRGESGGASSFSHDEQLIEGVRVSDKLLGLRALFGFKIANPIYHSVPPKGFFLSNRIVGALETDKNIPRLVKCCEELEQEIKLFKESLKLDPQRSAATEAILTLDRVRPKKFSSSTLDKSISYNFQQFRVSYTEESYAQEVWQPMEMKDYPKTTEFVKVHLLPTLRHNPLLKKHVRKSEMADVEIHRLVMKRFAVKGAQTAGLRSKPRSQRTPSKQRELNLEVIPELVNFMPKISTYSSTPPREEEVSTSDAGDDDLDLADSSTEAE